LVVQHRHVSGDLENEIHVMLDNHHADSRSERTDDLDEPGGGPSGQSSRRLVQEQRAWVGRQGRGRVELPTFPM
jgi:hypothetical protein